MTLFRLRDNLYRGSGDNLYMICFECKRAKRRDKMVGAFRKVVDGDKTVLHVNTVCDECAKKINDESGAAMEFNKAWERIE
jgi:protein-arginine kinase activator protein McsA